MENLVGILVFVLFVIFSIASRAAKDQRNRRQGGGGRQQQWPGPVAGPGPLGQPRRQPQAPPPVWQPQPPPVPTTTWAPRPAAPAAPQPQAQPAQPVRLDRGTLVSSDVFTTKLDETEGVSSEGPQESMNIPDPAAEVEREMDRFEQESERFGRQQLAQLSDDLAKQDLRPYTVTPDTEALNADLNDALADANGLKRAMVLAEVLGKPKALRGRGRRL